MTARIHPLQALVHEAILLAGDTPCAAGHLAWEHLGGCNAGCEIGRDCSCSIPVYGCKACGDSDYGDNEEAVAVRADCRERAGA